MKLLDRLLGRKPINAGRELRLMQIADDKARVRARCVIMSQQQGKPIPAFWEGY